MIYWMDVAENWDDWKSAFVCVSDKHAPIKTSRLKVRSNPWMTSDIVKLMYKRDKISRFSCKKEERLSYEWIQEIKKCSNRYDK